MEKLTEFPDYVWDDVTLTSLDLLREWLANHTYNQNDCQMGMKRLGGYFFLPPPEEIIDGTPGEG